MSHSVKDHHPFEKHVESTLLLVAIHRCKICNFYSSQSRVIYDHIRTSHAAIAAEDGATSSAGHPQLEEPNTPLKSVLKEIQNLDCFRTIPSNQVTLKILSDSRTDDYSRCWTEQSGREVVDPQLKLSSFYDFLIGESTLCTHERSPEDTANLLVKETLEGKQFKEQLATSQELDSAQGNSILDKTQKNVPEEPHARAAKTENDVSHTCTASATKQDFNRAYESWMEEGTIVKKKVRKKTKEKEGEILAEQNVSKAHSSDEVVSQGQAPRSGDGPFQESPLLSTVESGEISKTEKAASSCQEKIPQDDVPVQNLQSGEASMDVSATSFTDGNVATSSGDKEHGQTLQGGTSLPTQQLPPMKSEGSKLYGGVDFQGIAQRASQSNPEATTITVVQHTGGNRPPMTIHFKKSAKSEAIIPTGESLGIESPFLRKEYSGSKIFACKECHSRYKTANELERHVVKKHQKKKSYLCEICGDALATRSGMKTHIMRKHAVTEVLSCNVCDYMTRSSARLTVHMKKHNKDTSEFYCEPSAVARKQKPGPGPTRQISKFRIPTRKGPATRRITLTDYLKTKQNKSCLTYRLYSRHATCPNLEVRSVTGQQTLSSLLNPKHSPEYDFATTHKSTCTSISYSSVIGSSASHASNQQRGLNTPISQAQILLVHSLVKQHEIPCQRSVLSTCSTMIGPFVYQLQTRITWRAPYTHNQDLHTFWNVLKVKGCSPRSRNHGVMLQPARQLSDMP